MKAAKKEEKGDNTELLLKKLCRGNQKMRFSALDIKKLTSNEKTMGELGSQLSIRKNKY